MLATLVCTSVGVLGIAALQLATLRSNQDAYMQLQAGALAASMLERIRSNPVGLRAGDFDSVDFNSTAAANGAMQPDLAAWQAEIDRQLPGGPALAAGAVKRDPASNVVTVTVRWKVPMTDQNHVRTFSVEAEL